MKENIEQFITRHEGRRKKPYLDTAIPPKETIGVGWNMTARPLPVAMKAYLKEHGEITDAMVNQLLSLSIGFATSAAEDLFPEFETFSEDRQFALIDFCFQLGKRGASKFVHAVAAINTGRWKDAAKEMRNSDWFHQTPNRAHEICDIIEEGDA